MVGTLHLTPHHIIFSHTPPPPSSTDTSQAPGPSGRPKELWITYPIISLCTCRPTPAASRQPSSIRLRCRDFTFVCFYFTTESKARDVYETIKCWTCKVGRIDKLYAFSYRPPPPELKFNGWELYNPSKEWARQGVDQAGSGWRVSQLNADYGVNIYTSVHYRVNCCVDSHLSVFCHVSSFATSPLGHFRQYTESRWKISVSSESAGSYIPSSGEQLLHHTELTASCGCASKPKYPRRSVASSHILNLTLRETSCKLHPAWVRFGFLQFDPRKRLTQSYAG